MRTKRQIETSKRTVRQMHQKRRNETLRLLKRGYKKLIEENKEINKINLAKASGITTRTIYKYWDQIINESLSD